MATYQGYFDCLGHTSLSGWVYDAESPHRTVVVSIFANGELLGCVPAGTFRADLAAAGIGNGCHAFSFDLSGIISNVKSLVASVANADFELSASAPIDYAELTERLAAVSAQALPERSNLFLDDDYLAKLSRLAAANASAYQNADPYPFIVFDDFLPTQAASAAVRDFPSPKQLAWAKYSDKYTQRKLAFGAVEKLPLSLKTIIEFLNSQPALEFLQTLTGIDGLLPDPYYMGGGLHQTERGGRLAIHIDFNSHPKIRLDRRLNLLIYLNQDWDESYGGHLEIWNRDMSSAVCKILPILNRCVIFNTSEWSYHGQPDPVNCPADMTRKSIALYYYTNGRPEEERAEPHLTVWQERPAG